MNEMSAVNTLITSPEHIHVGAGSFGLGMVVDICHRRANFRTAVLSQYSGKEHQDLLRAQQSYAVVFDARSRASRNSQNQSALLCERRSLESRRTTSESLCGAHHYFGWEGKLTYSVSSAGSRLRKKKAERYCRKALRSRLRESFPELNRAANVRRISSDSRWSS